MSLKSFLKRIFGKQDVAVASPEPLTHRALDAERWFERMSFEEFRLLGGDKRLWNCLRQNRIISPLHLSAFTRQDFLECQGVGPKTALRADIVLAKFWLELGCNVKDKFRIEEALWPHLEKREHSYRALLPAPEFPPRQHPDGRWELCNKDFDAIQKAWLIPSTGDTSCPIPITTEIQ